jgi:hypothetical protein
MAEKKGIAHGVFQYTMHLSGWTEKNSETVGTLHHWDTELTPRFSMELHEGVSRSFRTGRLEREL